MICFVSQNERFVNEVWLRNVTSIGNIGAN